MLLTNSKLFKERADELRNLGFKKERRYFHSEIARNYRMTNLQAALGVAQVKNIKKFVRMKRERGKLYNKLLAGIPHVQLPVEKPWAKNIYWMYGIVLSARITALTFRKKLARQGIGTQPFFYPLHRQPVWRKAQYHKVREGNKGNFPVADRIAKQGLYLPSGLGTTEKEIKHVAAVVRRLLETKQNDK